MGVYAVPKALRALRAAGIKPYTARKGHAEELFEELLAGRLQEVTGGGSGRRGRNRV